LSIYKMILTQCAVCATELGLTLGKKCGRCSTRYCGPECQVQHWKEGGHDQLCKKIKKAGGAEQYNANKKYAEAVAVAAEACADDTKGQTCYICTQAVHWKTKEGLVRGCACRGTAGFAHVSCLAEQPKILVAEAEENNLDLAVKQARFNRWHTCSLCEQDYHGVVYCALGWACWKTYVGRAERDQSKRLAINMLGLGLSSANHHDDALVVKEATLAIMRRLGDSEDNMLAVQSNLANTYEVLGRYERALQMRQEAYSGRVRLNGEEHAQTLRAADNYALSLLKLRRFEEAKRLLRKVAPVARRVLGKDHELTLSLREDLCHAMLDEDSAADEKREALEMLKDTAGAMRRVLGPDHPDTVHAQTRLESYVEKYSESV
jgi:tetratricopeptide (TPR) repeat protein